MSKSYAIKSLAGTTLDNISGSQSVNVNVTTSIRYSVPLIEYPRGGNDPSPFFVEDYVWTVPSGWNITNKNISISNQIAFIDVTPDCCTGGQVTVKAKSNCGNFFSNVQQLTVTRFILAPGPISSSTGSMRVVCQSTTPATYSVAPVTGAESYTWTLPAGWSGSSTSTSIIATPNGINGGLVSVKANGGGLQSQASSTTIAVDLWNPNIPPSISGSSLVCYSGTTFNLANLPTYGSVSWTQSSNLSFVSGQGTTSYKVRANSTSISESGWVEAVISTPCGTAPAIRYNVWVGKPYNLLVSGPTQVTAGSFNVYTAVPWNGQPSFAVQGVSSTGFEWSFPLTSTNAGWICHVCNDQSGQITAGTQSTYVSVRAQNGCGFSPRKDYEVFVQQACPPEGCEEPFFVYPNPSSEELTVSSASNEADVTTSIVLTDSNGSVVYSTRGKSNARTKISVKEFKNGIYYLSVTENGKTKQRQVIIKH